MSLTGDFKKVQWWADRFKKLASGDTIEQLTQVLVDETLKLTRENFDKKQNPAGIPWRRRKQDKPWPLMVKTGKLRGSFRRGRGSGKTATVISMDPKSKFHQYGTKKMPRRQMLPGSFIPPRYSRAYVKAIRRKLMPIMMGKA